MTATQFAWDVLSSFLGTAFLLCLVLATVKIDERRREQRGSR